MVAGCACCWRAYPGSARPPSSGGLPSGWKGSSDGSIREAVLFEVGRTHGKLVIGHGADERVVRLAARLLNGADRPCRDGAGRTL